MHFPKSLYRKNRKQLSSTRINSINLMYARHKPGVEWKKGDEYPDFTKIKSDQSFNWNAYSLPSWVRFNDRKEYKADYGVLGYSVSTLKGKSKKNKDYKGLYFIIHDPKETNYSHCELAICDGVSITKKQKRGYRMTLSHKSKKCLQPYQKSYLISHFTQYPIMLVHRIISLIGMIKRK